MIATARLSRRSSYDERTLLNVVRDKAFGIRGKPRPPPREPPGAPKLLPISDPSAISWQSAAGAECYDVERASTSNGPWAVVGEDVSDADVQYRPQTTYVENLFLPARTELGVQELDLSGQRGS